MDIYDTTACCPAPPGPCTALGISPARRFAAFCLLLCSALFAWSPVHADACTDAVQGKIAWDYKGSKGWGSGNLKRLCRGAGNSAEPARCFQQVMHGGVDWGGGSQWQWKNALDLCEQSRSASRTVSCFRDRIAAGTNWSKAIAACDERAAVAAAPAPRPRPAPRPVTPSSASCSDAVQGKVAWDYKGNKSWGATNLARLCRGAERSAEPARCFQRVMHGGVNWGGGTRWQWKNALDLCEGSLNAATTVGCFQRAIAGGRKWSQAIAACDGRAGGAAVATAPRPQTAPPRATTSTPRRTTTPVMNNTTARILGASTEPDICWKDSYGRGVGKLPTQCRSGHERTGADLLCYPKCKRGYNGVGPVCWQNCPSGFRNDGAFCAKPKPYGRGAGYPWKFGDGLNDKAMRKRCEADHGRRGCEKNGAIFYPKCKKNFHNVGCCVCSPDCPSGMTDIGVSCAKKSYGRGVGEGALCGRGMEQGFKGGLCYPKCKSGTRGVGPVCWSRCPSDYPVNCGAACGISETACALAIMEQVQSTSDVALNVAALITTAGAGNAALKSARLAGKSAQRTLTKAARQQFKARARQQARNALKWQKRNKRVGNAQGWLEKAENMEAYSEMMADAYEQGEFDVTQLAPSVADIEPTGVLSVVNSFNKPICGR